MSNVNDFLPFCPTDSGTNLVEQPAYILDTGRTGGNVPGVARSALINKALRQPTYFISQLAQYMSDTLTQDVLDNAVPANLYSQIAQMFHFFTPPGSVKMFAGATAPLGWHFCDGSLVSRTTYPLLFAAIGTTYNAGDGSTTFGLPDARGMFIRGAGSNGAITMANGGAYASTLGAYQNDSVQAFGFQISVQSTNAGGNGTTTPMGGTAGTVQATQVWNLTSIIANGAGTPRIGTETRPASLGLNYMIKL